MLLMILHNHRSLVFLVFLRVFLHFLPLLVQWVYHHIFLASLFLTNLFDLPPLISVVSIMFYAAAFMMSWGPICWVLISEIFPNTIRSGAVAIAVAFQWIANFIVSSTFVPMYNMQQGAMGDKFGHFFVYALYGIICFIAAIFVWKLVPETKGMTLEQMSKMWKPSNKK